MTLPPFLALLKRTIICPWTGEPLHKKYVKTEISTAPTRTRLLTYTQKENPLLCWVNSEWQWISTLTDSLWQQSYIMYCACKAASNTIRPCVKLGKLALLTELPFESAATRSRDSELFMYYLLFLFWTLSGISYIDLFPPLWTTNLDIRWRVRTLKKAQVFTPGLCSQQELLLESDNDKIPQRKEKTFFWRLLLFSRHCPNVWALHTSSLTLCLLWSRLTPSQCWIVLLHRTNTGHNSLPTSSAHLILGSDITNWKTEPLSSDPGTWINN